MHETNLPSIWQTIHQALGLHEAIFVTIQQAPEGVGVALLVVCLASLSESLGQSVVLFINRVRFKRFILALLISTASHIIGYGLWTVTVWLVGDAIFGRREPFMALASAVGLAYAPQLFAFFGLTPLIGNAFAWLLSLWSLLAILVAVRVGLGLETWQALVISGLGWSLIQVWKRTLGRPIYALGRWLHRRAAGVPLEFTAHDLPRLRRHPQWLKNREPKQWANRKSRTSLTDPQVLYLHPPVNLNGSVPQGEQFFSLLGVVLIGVLVWAALAPFETLGWWAGWFGDKIYHDDLPADGLVRTVRPNADRYVIFLSGVGCVSGETFSYREQNFLQRLALALPQAVIIDDIFPYSVNNLALTGQPLFARLWRWALRCKIDGPQLAGYLINLRNIWQVLISADRRYGPLYNQAMAEVMLHGLLRYRYDAESNAPVYIIGYSGAAQIAVGAVTYLHEWVRGPIYVISLGGIFCSDPGLLAVAHPYHLYGEHDNAHQLSAIVPGRWACFPTSEWNRARRQGLISAIPLGPIGHTGVGGYLDAKRQLPGGIVYLDKTVQTIAAIVLDRSPIL